MWTTSNGRSRISRRLNRELAAGSGAFSHPDDRALMTDKRYEALKAWSLPTQGHPANHSALLSVILRD